MKAGWLLVAVIVIELQAGETRTMEVRLTTAP